MAKLLRVTQLDAIQLDKEILKILKTCTEDATKYLTPGLIVPYEPEINLLIRLCILRYSLLKSNATFGQKLLLIKYENLTVTKKLLYVIFSFISYLKDRCELSNPGHKINRYIYHVEILLKTSALVNLAIFLQTGIKPLLVDRILGLDQVYENYMPRKFDSKYMTRELLWNGFIELLVFVLPLINYHKIRRVFRNLFSFNRPNENEILRSEYRVYNSFTRCPHCLESPIQPHHMGCSHVFCYICLKSNQLADPKYECPLCGFSDTICERVAV